MDVEQVRSVLADELERQHERLYQRLAGELRAEATVQEEVRKRVDAALVEGRRQIEASVRDPLMSRHCGELAEVKALLAAAEQALATATAQLGKQLLVDRSAQAKGRQFEEFVRSTLEINMPWLATQDVSTQPHAMDLLVEVPSLRETRDTLRIGIDCKNRVTSVTHAELERFEQDSRQYDGGVLVLRRKCTIQRGWTHLSDNLIQVTRRLFIVTNFESNPQWLHYALSKVAVECAVDGDQQEEEVDSQHEHPRLRTVAVTNVFQAEAGLRGAIKKRKATVVF